jgi:hypothetical protein
MAFNFGNNQPPGTPGFSFGQPAALPPATTTAAAASAGMHLSVLVEHDQIIHIYTASFQEFQAIHSEGLLQQEVCFKARHPLRRPLHHLVSEHFQPPQAVNQQL